MYPCPAQLKVYFVSVVCLTVLLRGYCEKSYYSSSDRIYKGYKKRFTHVPQDIPPEAKKVKLNGNSISRVPAGVFNRLTQCVSLKLDGNEISVIEKHALKGMINLNKVTLIRNKLSIIQQGSLSGLFYLQTLYLSDNQINTIEEGAFDSLHCLMEVWLMNNLLTTLSPDLFINTLRVKRPIRLTLSSHDAKTDDWDCSSLCWLKHENWHRTISNQFMGVVANPLCAAGRAWESLQCGHTGETSLWLTQWLPLLR